MPKHDDDRKFAVINEQRIALIEVPCPEEVFESADAVIYRRKRIPVWKMDALKVSKTPDEVYDILASLVPKWKGVLGTEVDEVLGNPEHDPLVFGHLDSEQLTWIIKMLSVKWNDFTHPTQVAQM